MPNLTTNSNKLLYLLNSFLLDGQPPDLTCPEGTLEVDNDPGKNTSTVSWNFTFTDNSLTAGESGISEDLFKVILTIDDVNVTTSLPKLLGIGTNKVKYEVRDDAENTATCTFNVYVNGK